MNQQLEIIIFDKFQSLQQQELLSYKRRPITTTIFLPNMKQIKVRRGIDIAQNLFSNINFNRGRSQPPRAKEASLKQQNEFTQIQTQDDAAHVKSPRLTDKKGVHAGNIGVNGSKSIILEHIASSGNSAGADSLKLQAANQEPQHQRLGINQSVAQIHTLSQLNSERGSVHDHILPANQRPSMPPFSPQRGAKNQQRAVGMFDRLSMNQRSQVGSQKQKSGSSLQPSLRNQGSKDGHGSVVVMHQDQITGLHIKRGTRNFESKLGHAINHMHAGSIISQTQGPKNATDSQLMPTNQQKIVNVASMTERRHDTMITNNTQAKEEKPSKKSKKAQKAVVKKYQQIPQSMISNNRPTFQQLEKAQSISNISSVSDRQHEQDHDRAAKHVRQHYQDENYRSSPGNNNHRGMGKDATKVKKFKIQAADEQIDSQAGHTVDEQYTKAFSVPKVPTSPEKPKTKVQFENKPPQLANGDERDYQHSPQFTQTVQSQHHSDERARKFGSDVTDIESQSQHMQQWRRNQFPQDQSSQAQGVQNYKVLNFRPYQEDGESLKVNNTNMVNAEHDGQKLLRPSEAQPLRKMSRQNSNAVSKRSSKQSISSPKPPFGQQQEPVKSTEKPRTQSYYQRILNYAKTNKRSPKNRLEQESSQQDAGHNSTLDAIQQHSSPAIMNEANREQQNASGLKHMRMTNMQKIPQKHNSAVHAGPMVLAFDGHGQQKSLGNHTFSSKVMDSQMKTIPVTMNVDGEQRVSDLFSPARGKFDKNHQSHNTMTQSQIQNMKNSNEGLQLVGDIQFQDGDARRYTKAAAPKENDLIVPGFDGQIQDNQSQNFQQTREMGDFYAAQSFAMSPTNKIRMYDEILNQNPPSAISYNKSYQIKRTHAVKNAPASASQRSLERKAEPQAGTSKKSNNDNMDEPSLRFQSSTTYKNSEKAVSQGSNYALFNFRRKQGALKSNERQQSPRASSKQILAKQNLSKLTKPFAKNKAGEPGQVGANSYVAQNAGNEIDGTGQPHVRYGKSPMTALEQLKLKEQQASQTYKAEGLLKKVDGKEQQTSKKEDQQQSSILFGSSRDSCDIDGAGSKGEKNIRIISDSYSPQRPAINKFKHRTDITKQPSTMSASERGANIDMRMRNKKNFVTNIKQAHQNYINNKLKKMDSNNNINKLTNGKQQSDTPPRIHTSKFSMDVSDSGFVSNDFNTTPEKMQKVRTTFNSSKLKDQETASGATKQNSACLQSSIQGQQIGDGQIDEKDGGEDKDPQATNAQINMSNEDPEQEVKGWTIFKLKSWKNIFVKSNEKSREQEQTEKTGENDNTQDDQDSKKKDLKNTDVVKEEPQKENQKSTTSPDSQPVTELIEIKHQINCDCDKDPTYAFACKNGVVWFAANVIMLKIRRQQKLNDKVDVSKIILEEYEKCRKHYKSLKKLKPKQESALQIDRDLGRTFPKNQYFNQGQPGYKKLRNVLRAFSCYDDQADYVQGMNFLVGQLLMHCSATLAFWLFVELIEECELRDIYQVGLPGLHKHSFIINMLVKDHLPDLSKHFEEHNVVPEMYASDWIFGLFASILPENQTNVTAHFFSLFFQYKWEFFYKLILSILENLKPKLLEAQDMFSILQQIKIAMSNKNDPYTYGLIYQQEQQMQGQQKNRNKYTDHEMEDILGSIVSGQEETEGNVNQQVVAQTSLFSNIANFFKKSKDDGEREPVWQEFPWEQVIVKTDIIQKWKKVDMKKIHRLHANFDLDTGKFVNIEEERQQQEQQAKLGAAIATSLDKHQYNSKE